MVYNFCYKNNYIPATELFILGRCSFLPKKDNGFREWIGECKSTLNSIQDELEKLNKSIEHEADKREKIFQDMQKQINKNTILINHISEVLPAKGFCDRVNNDLYPEKTEEPSLPQKVVVLWNDRRWIKGVMYALLSIGVGNMVLLVGRYVLTGTI